MNEEIKFKNQLLALVDTAKQQSMCLSEDQVVEAFPEMDLGNGRIDLIYDYLKNNKIAIGNKEDVTEVFAESEEKLESDLAGQYLQELKELSIPEETELYPVYRAAMSGDKDAKYRIVEAFLPKVVELSRLYAGQKVLMEDVIGEGNVALALGVEMLGCLESEQEAEGFLGKMIMEAMENYILEEEKGTEFDRQVLDKVNRVLEAADELAGILLRKATIAEIAAETSMTEAEVEEVIEISGNQIDNICAETRTQS